MTSAADLEWLTDPSDVPEGGSVDCELRELSRQPDEVLATIEALAGGLALKGHAAGGRGRWGVIEFSPYMHAIVRVAAARPGTAVTVQLHVGGEWAPSAMTTGDWHEWAAIGASVGGALVLGALSVYPIFAACCVLSWLAARGGQRASRRASQRRAEAWRQRFWAELERGLAARTPYRSGG